MNQLNQRVEEIVGSIRASHSRKNKMREELIAHLMEIYFEESEKQQGPEITLHESLRRFGDPKILKQELQSSVPWMERIPTLGQSLAFAISIYLGVFIGSNALGLGRFCPLINGYNTSHSFALSMLLNFALFPWILSFLSRIVADRPRLNMQFQFFMLYILDLFLFMLSRPGIHPNLLHRYLLYFQIWDLIMVLGNLVCIYWIWNSYKHEINSPTKAAI